MADMLAEQARRRLIAEGAPISAQNLKWAIEELRANTDLQEGASSQNDMIAKFGGTNGPADRTRPPTVSKGTNIGQFANDPQMTDPGYVPGEGSFTADSQFGSNHLADQGKAKAARAKASEMAKADRKSGVMFKGGQGATPGTTRQSVSTESVDNTTHDTAPIPKVTATDITKNEVNQLASRRRPPAAQGAGQGGNEQVAAAARPTPARPPASPGTTAAQPAAAQGPQPSVPVPPNTAGVPAPTGATRLQPTTPPDWPGSTRWTGPSVTMPIPGAPAPTQLATPAAPSISPAVAAPVPPPGPAAPGMMSQIGSAISGLLGGLPTIPPGAPPVGGGPIGGTAVPDIAAAQAQAGRAQATQALAPRMGGDPGQAYPLISPETMSDVGRVRSWAQPGIDSIMNDLNGQFQNPHLPAVPPQIASIPGDMATRLGQAAAPVTDPIVAATQSALQAPYAPRPPVGRLPAIPQGMTIGDTAAMSGAGAQGKPSPPPPRRGSLKRKPKRAQGNQR